jgi:glutathione synthase/RimK-type ligase-like ATP-grasp enzyme
MKPLLIFAAAFALICCSQQHTDTAKTKTLAAWKAMQKAEHDNAFEASKGNLDDPSTLIPLIKYFQDVAFAYSQIDLDGVDEILVNHLKSAMRVLEANAEAEQSAYNDIVAIMKSREKNAATSLFSSSAFPSPSKSW